MKAISTPPLVHRTALENPSVERSLGLAVNLRSGSTTSWRMLWLSFTILKMAGLRIGTYQNVPGNGGQAYHVAKMSEIHTERRQPQERPKI